MCSQMGVTSNVSVGNLARWARASIEQGLMSGTSLAGKVVALPETAPTAVGGRQTLEAEGGDLRGRRVGWQLYGQEPNLALVAFLEGAGAAVSSVAPYAYAPASDEAKVAELIAALAGGGIDAV